MAMSGATPQYFIHKGGVSGGGSGSGAQHSHSGLSTPPPAFRALSNPHHVHASQSSIRTNIAGQAFSVDPLPHTSFGHGISIGATPMAALPSSEPVKKKRGRPRKYGPDGKVALGLLTMSGTTPGSSPGSSTPLPKRARGRPPGSGRKQRLASVGEWMNDSAGLAFAPHVIRVGSGEDVAAKILSFSQQRPRAVCVLSGCGTVSLVTLRQPASSGGNITYEGRFEILCLSGSYLLAEDGGPRNRTGGVSVSLSSPDGHVIGGSVGMLIAAGPVQVVVCSFVYGSSKPKDKQLAAPKAEDDAKSQSGEKSFALTSTSTQNFTSSALAIWPSSQALDLKHLHTDIDLMRG